MGNVQNPFSLSLQSPEENLTFIPYLCFFESATSPDEDIGTAWQNVRQFFPLRETRHIFTLVQARLETAAESYVGIPCSLVLHRPGGSIVHLPPSILSANKGQENLRLWIQCLPAEKGDHQAGSYTVQAVCNKRVVSTGSFIIE